MKLWLDPEISWKTYKYLHDKTAGKDGGPTPNRFAEVLWEMLRDRQINIYITDENKDDPWVPTLADIPNGSEIISDPLD